MIHLISVIVFTWTMTEKSLATDGCTPRTRVMTGKATAPPPSLVIPANDENQIELSNKPSRVILVASREHISR